MAKKIGIESAPPDGEKGYYHLTPVVDFLIKNGNKSQNDYIWGVNRTGYFCHLVDKIDFDLLQENFDFPESIKLDEKDQTIDCFTTYTIIKGFTGIKS